MDVGWGNYQAIVVLGLQSERGSLSESGFVDRSEINLDTLWNPLGSVLKNPDMQAMPRLSKSDTGDEPQEPVLSKAPLPHPLPGVPGCNQEVIFLHTVHFDPWRQFGHVWRHFPAVATGGKRYRHLVG